MNFSSDPDIRLLNSKLPLFVRFLTLYNDLSNLKSQSLFYNFL